jgi:hypothetical protein
MTQTPGSAYGDEEPGSTSSTPGTSEDAGRNQAGREWLTQLQSMIDNVATAAAPVLRDVAAKAAELAATAGEKAGPVAHKAAEATEAAGQKLAERGREVAAELRRGKDGETATPEAPTTIVTSGSPGSSTSTGSPGSSTSTGSPSETRESVGE